MSATSRRAGRPRLSDEVLKERTAAILDTTLDLVATMGVDNVRLRDVADAADVSVGTLQHYFYTRDRMLQSAFVRHMRGVVETIERYADAATPPAQRILSLLGGVTDDPAFGRRAQLWIEFAAAAIRDADLRALMQEAFDSWRRMLEEAVHEGIASGEFHSPLAPDVLVTALLSLIDGNELALAVQVTGTTPETISDQLEHVTRTLLGIG